MGMKFMFLAFVVFVSFFILVTTEPIEDKQALLQFAQNIHHSVLGWDPNSSACRNWTGITCNQDESRIIAVRLPAVGFRGPIPTDTLSRLSALELLSLRFNAISGPFPSDFYKLGNLTGLHFQYNEFFGSLPLDFSVWKNLRVIDLSNNGFNGSVPVSISNLSQLTSLNLANNSISGELPDLNIPSLRFLNLSYNDLTGNVPESLRRFSGSAFIGNKFSPGNFVIPPAAPPSAQTSEKSTKLSESAVLGIAVSGLVMGFVILFVILIVCHSNKNHKKNNPVKPKTKEKTIKKAISLSQDDESTSLVFFQGSNLAFDLEDLLRASAEVLGKGTFGTTYKAALEDSATVVVKRLKEGCVVRREFEQQMEVVGSIKHENVVSLRAYYYSKDEKLVVYDYFGQGSVSTMLHSKSDQDKASVNWETRLRIAVGAARGIAHIHTKNTTIVHGNIKASNIFLNSQQEGCVCDLGLATLMSPIATPVVRTPGYRAPEVIDTRKVSQASDVYSFGVLLLELLTGKSPVRTTGSDEVVNLVRWVTSVVREEWTAEVFDVGLLKYPNIEEEMLEMLQIGMACVARVPEQRPKMAEVLKIVEDIGRKNTGNQPSSRNKSEASTPTPTMTEMGSPLAM